MDQSREAAYTILLNMEKSGGYSNLEVKKGLEKKDIPSPDLVRRLVYGVTEKRIYLDYYLDKLLARGIKETKPALLTILRLGAYQLDFMDSVPDYAAISTSVELCKKHIKGMEKLVNGVLRGWQKKEEKGISLPDEKKEPLEYLSVKYSCHSSILELLKEQYGLDRTRKILEALEEPKALAIRVNTEAVDIEKAKEELEEEGFLVLESALSNRVLLIERDKKLEESKAKAITETHLYTEGLISIQSEESCLIADTVEARPDDTILDMCAAPGGKTFAMAESMKVKGEIDALDIYPHRVSLMEEGKKRLGLDIVHPKVMDGRDAWKGKEEYYEKVLIDAPCSGLGVMRKKPEIKYKDVSEDLQELYLLQRELLESGIKALKKGGRLVYSTCTINKKENHLLVQEFLQGCPVISLISERQLMPDEGYDGFYIAVMEKNDNIRKYIIVPKE